MGKFYPIALTNVGHCWTRKVSNHYLFLLERSTWCNLCVWCHRQRILYTYGAVLPRNGKIFNWTIKTTSCRNKSRSGKQKSCYRRWGTGLTDVFSVSLFSRNLLIHGMFHSPKSVLKLGKTLKNLSLHTSRLLTKTWIWSYHNQTTKHKLLRPKNRDNLGGIHSDGFLNQIRSKLYSNSKWPLWVQITISW